ncbi:Glucan 1,3-beta-glucosidase [Drechslerella dactyloides]|uniref:Glucan 1,3-beta-glucosidase n=1 Tax=Drechslerella dactyloides TaxID=74499 RepID=A0AAD6NJN0_DREDA|nr:Glucan 1,3-beta-glucosidase [Drechslerella dactyloides]
MDDRRRRGHSDASSSQEGDMYAKPIGFINTRNRIYTLLTLGSILCYMYYIFQSSSFHGYRFWVYDDAKQKPVGDTASSTATTVVEVDVTKVISTVYEAAPTASASTFWLANMEHRGVAPYHSDKQYKVFRNVRDYGAKGDGIADDTNAINLAISSGSRCGEGCDSSTISPALVYFPPGRYRVSAPIVAMYYTQLVGNPLDKPVLLAAKSFKGMAVIDTDPYGPYGENWYINQNNFFRGIRNFVIDLTEMDPAEGVGIHHQVAQATSIYNVIFKMHEGAETKQKGIFMDNGSGGFLSSLTFYGGEFGAFFGNQQFTTINLEFHNCKTAIFVNWDWVWLLKSIRIYNCEIGVDITSGGPDKLGVGSVLLLDSYIEDTPTGIRTYRKTDSKPPAGGTLVVQNLQISGVFTTVLGFGDERLIGGNEQGGKTTFTFWGHGRGYSYDIRNGTDINVVADDTQDSIPTALKDAAGKILERPRPLYRHIPAHRFVSVKAHGAIGDGQADDTAAIQQILSAYGNTPPGQEKKIIFFDYGVYRVSQTIYVPPNTYIVGEMWSVIMSSGSAFNDADNPRPVFQVGKPGEEGIVEMYTHDVPLARSFGGSHGTQLQSDHCRKTPDSKVHPGLGIPCIAAFMLLHIGKTASLVMENMWLWTSDHDLDADGHDQISIYTGRGLLCEAETGPVWMYGHAVEHNVLYNYQLVDTKNIFMGVIQTETPYYQSNPRAHEPFPSLSAWQDPDFTASCATEKDKASLCEKSWGLRILNSTDIFAFGAGLYSFFENYDTACIEKRACQQTMVEVQGVRKSSTVSSRSNIWLMGLNTIGTEIMAAWTRADGEVVQVKSADGNRNAFSDTVGLILL